MERYNRRGWINSHAGTGDNFRISGYGDFDKPDERSIELSISGGGDAAHVMFDTPAALKKLIEELEAAYKWATASPSAPKKKPSAK